MLQSVSKWRVSFGFSFVLTAGAVCSAFTRGTVEISLCVENQAAYWVCSIPVYACEVIQNGFVVTAAFVWRQLEGDTTAALTARTSSLYCCAEKITFAISNQRVLHRVSSIAVAIRKVPHHRLRPRSG